MALKFSSVYAEATLHGVKMLVYGRSGMGKTSLLATAPKPIIGSAEAGLLSLSRENQIRMYGVASDVPVALIQTLADLIEFREACDHPDFPFETVALDSVTELGELVLANALAQVKDPRQAYGELLEKMTSVLKSFRDLSGKHVVFVAKESTNQEGCTPLHIPAMPGNKMGRAMPYLFDEVFHLDVGTLTDGVTKYRYLQTQPDINFDAKDRSGALDPIEEPNLTKLINKIVS